MSVQTVIAQAQEYMAGHDISGWQLYDYRGMNPIFWDTVGPVANVTRPCWLWIPVSGTPRLLVAYVDQGRFGHLGLDTTLFAGRKDMTANLTGMLAGDLRIAMEYSPDGLLPRVSKVDAGTLEFVRGLGVEVVSSADLLQYATQR
ncbi:MAG: aminopeptidase P family protein, partial [Chloroflexi bacterium]|nr:aminopeptidase P family protein [Chloroflexota bacterium]